MINLYREIQAQLDMQYGMPQMGTAAPVAPTEAGGMRHPEFPTNTLHPVFSAGQSTSNPTGSQLGGWERKQTNWGKKPSQKLGGN